VKVRPAPAGVTLVEMLIVVALIGLLAGVSFPSVASGVDTLRLNAAGDSLVSFFNEALNRAERRQQAVEITVLRRERALTARSSEAGFERRLELPQGVTIRAVLPPSGEDEEAPRTFLLLPGGAVPRFGVEFANSRNARRVVRVDPITGVPRVERVE
jgi:prepilin-type N-terminal cleavage/methylation domain-containing protein